MKFFSSNTSTMLFVIISVTANAQKTDQVQLAHLANEKKIHTEIVDEHVAQLLVNMADTRMMQLKEGKLALEKGLTYSVKEYGLLMLTDQTLLLSKIRDMALKLNVTLPFDISNGKEVGLNELAKESGKSFEQKFIAMMIMDHEGDIRLFELALDCKDRDVRAFAMEYLPMIQSHLSKIRKIKESFK